MLILCEHASNRIPACLHDLGLKRDTLDSHVAWDPGAQAVARSLQERMQAVLVSGAISRLVYDCNRPPDAPSAMPERSEVYDIPGNRGLGPDQRAERIDKVYHPFVSAVAEAFDRHGRTLEIMVTIHSFTPIYHGQRREVELGLLHGADDRLAQAMMRLKPADLAHDTRLNAPYSAADGVAHSLDLHGTTRGLPNVMIEIRNDLIRSPAQQDAMAARLAPWISRAQVDLTPSRGAS